MNGFYTKLKNIVGQGLEVVNGVTQWVIRPSLDQRSYGAEVEGVVTPLPGLQFQGNVTVLKAELGGGIDSLAQFVGRRRAGCAHQPGKPGGPVFARRRQGTSAQGRLALGRLPLQRRPADPARPSTRRSCRSTTTSTSVSGSTSRAPARGSTSIC